MNTKKPTSSGLLAMVSLLLAVFCFQGQAAGQVLTGITPSTWAVSSHTDQASNQTYNQESLVKLTDSRVSWGPAEDQMMEFDIEAANGLWDKQSNLGKLNLTVRAEGVAGDFTIEGTRDKITITIDLSFGNGASKLQLNVSQVSYP